MISDKFPSTLTQALEDEYKFSINLKHIPLIAKWWIFIITLNTGTVSYAYLRWLHLDF